MSAYRIVAFDLDGTLMDTSEGIFSAAIAAAAELGLPRPGSDSLRRFIGPPIRMSFMDEFRLDAEAATKAVEVFRSHYLGGEMYKAAPYPGIVDALGRLRAKGISLRVATYKREDMAIAILERFGMSGLFESIRGADAENKMSKTDIIMLAVPEISRTGTGGIAYVGDAESDASSAAELGLDFFAALYGFGFKDERNPSLASCSGMARNASDIARIFAL